MANAFIEQLKISGKTVMIGSDCPEMNENLIIKSFDALKELDVVLGPARDGGIYLIGLKNMNQELFQDIPWGSSSVFEKLKENAERLSLKVFVMEEKQDIDYNSDFLKWQNEFEQFNELQKNVVKRAS